jgi:hypothetical protein
VEAAHLIGLAIEQTIRPRKLNPADLGDELLEKGLVGTICSHGFGNWAADQLWGKAYDAAVLDRMDEDDEARKIEGIGLEGNGGTKGVELHAAAEYEHDDVYKKGEDGALEKTTEDVVRLVASVGLDLGGVEFEAEGEIEFPDTARFTMGIGLDAAENPTAFLVAEGARSVLYKLSSLAKPLDSVYANIVDSISGMLAKIGDGMATYMEVEAEYDCITGELTVTVRSKTKLGNHEDDGEYEYEVEIERGAVDEKETFQVGRL